MKRITLLMSLALAAAVSVNAQIPDPGDPVCAHCGVDLKSQVPHKRSCPYYEEPTSEESTSSSSSSSVSSSASKPSRPFNERTDGDPAEYGRGSYKCPECNSLYHTSSCQLGKVQSEYRKLHDEIRFGDKKWKKKAYKEALEKREQLWSELKRRINDAWWKKDHPSNTYSSSSYSSNYSSAQQPSTKLKDYTPATERPVVSEPLMEMTVCQPAPQFSSINETNIRHEKPVSIIGKHEWGEIDGALIGAIESNNDEEIPMEFDIERYNHDKGTAILGTHMDNGRYHWTILCHLGGGAYTYISQKELKEGYSNYKNIGELTDVHFDGQGKYIIAEYTSGYRQVYDCRGEMLREGYNIRVLGSTVDGKRLLYIGEDEQTVMSIIFNEDGEVIGNGHTIIQYDDALIDQWDSSSPYQLKNWRGEPLEIDGINGFEEIKAFNNQGSYYLLKDKDKGYALIGRGFIRYGGWYDTEEEAHRVWKSYHP